MSRPTTCGGCVTIWHQAGNRTGHCSQCHQTFSGITAFDAHQHVKSGRVVCTPADDLLDKTGIPKFKAVTDSCGATVWRSAVSQPKNIFERES